MKKSLLGLICICFLLALPALSMAATGWYGSVNAGWASLSDGDWKLNGVNNGEMEYETGYTIGVAVGYTMEAFRVEGEITYQRNDGDEYNGVSDDSEELFITYLVNGYYDFAAWGNFVPYLTAGIGGVSIDDKQPGTSWDENAKVFAYQLGAGVGVPLTEKLTLDFRYRFLSMTDPTFSDGGSSWKTEFDSHNLTAGLRMAF